MKRMVLDIEAVPLEKGPPPPSFKEKILRQKPKKSPPLSQKIVCICYAINSSDVQTLSGDEATLLKDFWHAAKEVDLFVGFGIFDYDLKLIWQRSVIHNIHPTVDIEFVKRTSKPIYDIAYEWSKWSGGVGSRISLDNLAKLLGLPSPKSGEITGRTVSKAYSEGRHKEIYEYCARDVSVTRSIYLRLTFQTPHQ